MKLVFTLLALLVSLSYQAQVEDIEVMCYNLMFYKAGSPPCSHSRNQAERDADLRTIVEYVSPDILAVNELGSNPVNPPLMLNNIFNVNGTTHYAHANTTNNSSSSLVNNIFYNQDKLGLISQEKVERDVNGTPLVRIVDFYRLYVKDPALAEPDADTVFLSLGVMHLKAGSDPNDQAARQRAAAAVMQHIDQNVADDNILLCGDMNIKTSSEAAYQEFTNYSTSSLSMIDPLGRPGNWNNNSSFADIHTQSTHRNSEGCFVGGGMDDRFDFILSSSAIENGSSGITSVNYNTIGQDGGSFNGDLNTNTNFSINSTVATALYNFSDHLPVSLELEADVSGLSSQEESYLATALWAPNPIKNQLSVHFEKWPSGEELSLQVTDLLGRRVARVHLPKGHEQVQHDFDSSNWPAGVYLLQVHSKGKEKITRKIVKH